MMCAGCKKLTSYGGYFQLFGWLCTDCKKEDIIFNKIYSCTKKIIQKLKEIINGRK